MSSSELQTEPPATPAVSDPSSDVRPFLTACVVFLLFMLALGGYMLHQRGQTTDFRSFYSAGVLLRTDRAHLYDLAAQQRVQDARIFPAPLLPFFHPSYEALLYTPFALLSYTLAYLGFMVFSMALLVASFFAAKPVFSRPLPGLQPRPGLSFFLFIPVFAAIWQGQDSLAFFFLCCLCWRELEGGHDLRAGCWLALALFRFQLALPLAALLALRRGWRFLGGFAATGAAVTLLSFALVGPAGITTLFHLLSAGSLSSDQGAAAQQVMAIYPRAMPNLFGLLYALGTHLLPARVAFAVIAVLSALLFCASAWSVRRAASEHTAFAIAVLTSVLVSYHLYFHDATLLLLPILLLAEAKPSFPALALYYLPALLLVLGGSNWAFLLALPMLALLFQATRTRALPFSAQMSGATPLYTQD